MTLDSGTYYYGLVTGGFSEITNAVSEVTGDTRYIKKFTIEWSNFPHCERLNSAPYAQVHCPLCDGDSTDILCILGHPALPTGEGIPPEFYMGRSPDTPCLWGGDAVFCPDITTIYTARLTATIVDCHITWTLRITKNTGELLPPLGPEFIEYTRDYTVGNATTDCNGAYLLQENNRLGMSEFGNAFHIDGGSPLPCSELEPPPPTIDPIDWYNLGTPYLEADVEGFAFPITMVDYTDYAAHWAQYFGPIYCDRSTGCWTMNIDITATYVTNRCGTPYMEIVLRFWWTAFEGCSDSPAEPPLTCGFGIPGIPGSARLSLSDFLAGTPVIIGAWSIWMPYHL